MHLARFGAFLTLASALIGVSCTRNASSYVVSGNNFFNAGKFEDASLEYRNAIQKDPHFGEAYYRLGLAELKKPDSFPVAYRALLRATELDPDNQDAKIQLGDLVLAAYLADNHRSQDLYHQITRISNQLLAKNPTSIDGLRLKGQLAMSDKKFGEAIQTLRQANALSPFDPKLVVPLTESLMQDNHFAESEKLALALIQKDKTCGAIYDVLYLQYMRTNRLEDAKRLLQTKANNNPKVAAYGLQLAEYYVARQQPDQANATLQQLLDKAKDFPNVNLQIGNFCLRTGRPREAVRHFEEGKRLNPKDKIPYERAIAAALSALGGKDDAIRVLQGILKEQPNDDNSRSMMATLLLESRKPENIETALLEFKELIKRRPNVVDGYLNLGRARMAKGDVDGSQQEFLRALELQPDSLPARLYLGDLATQKERYAEALKYADEALARQPREPRAKLLRGISLMGLKRYAEAHAELEGLVKDWPQYLEAQLQLGLLNTTERKFKDAQVIFQKLYAPGAADVRPLRGLINSYTGQQQFDHVIRILTEELAKSRVPGQIRTLLASTYLAAGRVDSALEQFQQALTHDPKAVQPYLGIAQIWETKGQLEKALASFQKAQDLSPADPTLMVPILASIAFLQDALGQKQEAIGTYRKVLAIKPENAPALNNLAFILTEASGNLDEALTLIERARRETTNPAFDDTLGLIYLKKNMVESATRVFDRLVISYPNQPSYRYHLGQAFLQQGKRAKAKEQLQLALTQQPSRSKEEALKIQELLSTID